VKEKDAQIEALQMQAQVTVQEFTRQREERIRELHARKEALDKEFNELDDEKALELSWLVQNTTLTELLFSANRVSLRSFNAHSRLAAPDLVTDV